MEHVPGLERLGEQVGRGGCGQEMTTGMIFTRRGSWILVQMGCT